MSIISVTGCKGPGQKTLRNRTNDKNTGNRGNIPVSCVLFDSFLQRRRRRVSVSKAQVRATEAMCIRSRGV